MFPVFILSSNRESRLPQFLGALVATVATAAAALVRTAALAACQVRHSHVRTARPDVANALRAREATAHHIGRRSRHLADRVAGRVDEVAERAPQALGQVIALAALTSATLCHFYSKAL